MTLEPCPFCGGPGTLNTFEAARWWSSSVDCDAPDCCAEVGSFDAPTWEESRAGAAAAWNRRSLPPPGDRGERTAATVARAFVNGFWGMVEKVPGGRGERLVERLTAMLEADRSRPPLDLGEAVLGVGCEIHLARPGEPCGSRVPLSGSGQFAKFVCLDRLRLAAAQGRHTDNTPEGTR